MNKRANTQGWGEIEVGDLVTSQGRHGAGQPAVTGRVLVIDGQHVTIQVTRDRRRRAHRTIKNLRKVGPR
jgi:hypothetical protein